LNKGITLGLLLTLLYLLHNDFWLWWRSDLVLGGIPVGLAYHVGYCLAISLFWALVVRRLGSPDPTT
jgi:hypothetical protein